MKDGNGNTPVLSAQDLMHVKSLTGWNNQSDVFGRDNGVRAVGDIIAEVASDQHWSIFGIFSAATGERALFESTFAHSMLDKDYGLYLQLGVTYKF